jgi:hypothetical protein
MAAIDFPNSPAVNDIFTAGNSTYKWTGVAWIANNLSSITWTSVTDKPTTFAPSAHTHATSEVTGLDSALSGKAATVHTHTISQITDYVPPVVSYTDTFMLMGA